jgi:hypothetical protein
LLQIPEDGVTDPPLLAGEGLVLGQEPVNLLPELSGHDGWGVGLLPVVLGHVRLVRILGDGMTGDSEFLGNLALRPAFHMEQLSDILNMSHLDHPLPPVNR